MGGDWEYWTYQQLEAAKAQWRGRGSSIFTKLALRKSVPITVAFDPNIKNPRGESLLVSVIRYIANEVEQIDHLKLLLQLEADANIADKQGRTPLFFACMEQKPSSAIFLIKHFPMDFRKKDRNGNTAIMYAASYGMRPALELLISKALQTWSVDAFKERNNMGNTAQRMALLKNHKDCAVLLDKKRIQLLQRMNSQLVLLNETAREKGWETWNGGFVTTYKYGNAWRRKVGDRKKERENIALSARSASVTDAEMSALLEKAGMSKKKTTLAPLSSAVVKRSKSAMAPY